MPPLWGLFFLEVKIMLEIGDRVIPRDREIDSGGRMNVKKIVDIGYMSGIMPIYHLENDFCTYTEDELILHMKGLKQ